MDRRGFLRGVVTAVGTAGLVSVQPDIIIPEVMPVEGDRFAFGKEIPPEGFHYPNDAQMMLYDAQGRAVAIVTSIRVDRGLHDMSVLHDSTRQFVVAPGSSASLEADIICPVTYKDQRVFSPLPRSRR